MSEIMVVDRDVILSAQPFQGYEPAGGIDYEAIVLDNYRFEPRERAENDPSLKQPVAYCMIVNPGKRLVFAYRRAGGGDYYEERLRGKWSIGIGGHIDPGDAGAPNPIRASMMREIEEEIDFDGKLAPRILGYINDDVDMVGRVHFGLLYVAETGATSIAPRSKEIAETRMVSTGQWRAMIEDVSLVVEGWSLIAWKALLADPRLGILWG